MDLHENQISGSQYRDSFLVNLNQVEYSVLVMNVLLTALNDMPEEVMSSLNMRKLLYQFVKEICFLHERNITHGGTT